MEECGQVVKWFDRRRSKYSDRIRSQSHIVHHKVYMEWPGIESRPPQGKAGD